MNILVDTTGYKVLDVVSFSVVKQTSFMKDEWERVKSGFSGKENTFYENGLGELTDSAKAKLKVLADGNPISDIKFTNEIKEVKNDVTLMVTVQAYIMKKV